MEPRHTAVNLLASVVLALTTVVSQNVSAQTTVMISTTPAPAAPLLQGPFEVGILPASQFTFAVPATGQAPLTYSATGLPPGLTLNASGVISGTAPAAGSYPIEVKVTNSAGSATASYTVVAGNTLALTPPMGWNSYDSFGASVTEQDMLDQAKAVRTHLQPHGWNYVVIDYRWYEPGQPLDANGRYLPVTSKYPSATGSIGLKSLADKIHALGLGFGIHIMRGVARKAYDANLPIAGSTYTTRDAGDPNSPCPWDTHMWGVRGDTPAGQAWYDALFQQYAAWGVDFVKIDDMLNNDTRTFHQAEADAIRRSADKTGRSIVLSFSPGPNEPSWLPRSAAGLVKTANMWRVVNDFWDYNALTDLPGVFAEASAWQAVTTLTRGHWPDLDMLPLGYLGPRNEWHASGQTTFSRNEQVTIMTLWSVLPSPLMYGGNPARLVDDAWTLALLTNPEVLAVNQDLLGARGRRTSITGGDLWVRELSGGRKAVAQFNRGAQDAKLSASFAQIGVTGTPGVRDLWRRMDVTGVTTGLSVDVPGKSAVLYALSPSTATGGTSGTGGAASSGGAGGVSAAGGAVNPTAGGSAGAPGAGGAGGAAVGGSAGAGTSGAPGSGGLIGSGSGGTINGAGGTTLSYGGSSPTTGGATTGTASGGATNASGGASSAAGATATPAPADRGCGCSVPGSAGGPGAASLLLGAVALGAARRRRAARHASFRSR